MALLRYRLGRDIEGEDRTPVYVVIDHGPATIGDDGQPVYTEDGAQIIHSQPYTPEGKASCQMAVLTGNAQERAANGSTNAPADAAELGSATITTNVSQEA